MREGQEDRGKTAVSRASFALPARKRLITPEDQDDELENAYARGYNAALDDMEATTTITPASAAQCEREMVALGSHCASPDEHPEP